MKLSKAWVIGGAAIATLALALLAYKYLFPYAFTIDGKTYSRQEVSKLTAYPRAARKISDGAARKLAYDYLLDRAAGQKAGITFTDVEMKSMVHTISSFSKVNSDGHQDWLELEAYNRLLKVRLLNDNPTPQAMGYSFVFYFGQHQEKGYEYIPVGYGNKTLIAADRAYAEQKAHQYHDALDRGEVDPDRLIETIRSDDRLSYKTVGDSFTYSTAFDTKDPEWQTKLFYKEIIDFVPKAPKGVSDIRVGKTSTVPAPRSDADYAETFFYFTKFGQTAGNATTLQQQLKDQKVKIKAYYYG